MRKDTSFGEGREKAIMNLNHSYEEESSKECTISVNYLSLYLLFTRASDLNLKSSTTGDKPNYQKVENSVSPESRALSYLPSE